MKVGAVNNVGLETHSCPKLELCARDASHLPAFTFLEGCPRSGEDAPTKLERCVHPSSEHSASTRFQSSGRWTQSATRELMQRLFTQTILAQFPRFM